MFLSVFLLGVFEKCLGNRNKFAEKIAAFSSTVNSHALRVNCNTSKFKDSIVKDWVSCARFKGVELFLRS